VLEVRKLHLWSQTRSIRESFERVNSLSTQHAHFSSKEESVQSRISTWQNTADSALANYQRTHLRNVFIGQLPSSQSHRRPPIRSGRTSRSPPASPRRRPPRVSHPCTQRTSRKRSRNSRTTRPTHQRRLRTNPKHPSRRRQNKTLTSNRHRRSSKPTRRTTLLPNPRPQRSSPATSHPPYNRRSSVGCCQAGRALYVGVRRAFRRRRFVPRGLVRVHRS
jgi:hypothetical protein